MKYWVWALAAAALLVGAASCKAPTDYSGTYTGYSWSGEAKGVTLEAATQKIETVLTLDKDGTIRDAKMLFLRKVGDQWVARQTTEAQVTADFSVDPAAATPGEDYKRGTSMFKVEAVDMMSLYAVAVSEAGAAALVVDPITRYQFEMKLPAGFDYATPVQALTVASGRLVPTVRTSGSGLLRPKDWAELGDKHLFNIHPYSNVLTLRGVFQGLRGDSSVQDLLSRMGAEFDGTRPKPTAVRYGYSGAGGWAGNYRAIEQFLVGKKATELTSLVDWSVKRWGDAVNKDNFFGLEAVAGATRTAQSSTDTIAGATVRMSRESTSYQRALVQAGVIAETDVIKGRF